MEKNEILLDGLLQATQKDRELLNKLHRYLIQLNLHGLNTENYEKLQKLLKELNI